MSIIKDYVKNTHHKSSVYLLKIRLWFYCLVYLYMIVVGIILLLIDFSRAEDRLVRLYHHNRWLLITTWFNLISLVYTPICIYCDWRELRGTDSRHVNILNQIRFVCFTSILYPATAFSDILFWQLWIKDRELVVPPAVDALVPMWLQHSLHTATLWQVIVDLLLVPRRRPKNLKLGASLLGMFLGVYSIVCARSIITDEHIYPLLRRFSGINFIPLVIFVSVEHFLFFTTQWFVIDFVWGKKSKADGQYFSSMSKNNELNVNLGKK